MKDIDSLLGRGEVPGLFSTKEKNELNEVTFNKIKYFKRVTINM